MRIYSPTTLRTMSKNNCALVDNDYADHSVMMSAIPSEFRPRVAAHNRRSAAHGDARLYRILHEIPRLVSQSPSVVAPKHGDSVWVSPGLPPHLQGCLSEGAGGDFYESGLSYSVLLTLRGEERGGETKTVTGDEVQGSPPPPPPYL